MSTEQVSWKERLLYTRPDDDRSRMRAVANNLILHLHPTKVPASALRFTYTWGLGGISALLLAILITTGVLLIFRYDASVERAYTSIQFLETQVAFGSLLRAVHHWAGNLLLITAFLHMVRVFYTGSFKGGRATNWLVGLVLLLIVVAFNFTGYLLPWDQLAYWAITVGTSLLGYIPFIGGALSQFLLGGPEVGQGTLRNFYAIHVAVLPALVLFVVSYHFWRVRKDGGISQPRRRPGERVERLTTIPHLVQVEAATASLVLTLPVPQVDDAFLEQVAALGPEGAVWAQGMALYAEHCTVCHGVNGEGSDLGVPLNTPEVRATEEAELARIIREGVPGTMMASWDRALTFEEIEALVAFLRNWETIQEAGLVLTPPAPIHVDLSNPEEVLALGERIFNTTCAACHGENGTGGMGPAINSQQFLGRHSDEQIRDAILYGGRRPNSSMPAFGDRLTSVEVEALVRFIRAWEPTAPWVANPRGTEQGGGPPWLRATPDPDTPIAPHRGRRPEAGRGGGPPWRTAPGK